MVKWGKGCTLPLIIYYIRPSYSGSPLFHYPYLHSFFPFLLFLPYALHLISPLYSSRSTFLFSNPPLHVPPIPSTFTFYLTPSLSSSLFYPYHCLQSSECHHQEIIRIKRQPLCQSPDHSSITITVQTRSIASILT